MSRRFSLPWTPERDQEAIRLRRAGQTYPEIADALQTTRENVLRRLHELGASTNPFKPNAGRLQSATLKPRTKPAPSGTQRNCMCCRTPFNSAGPQNRLCRTCRRIDVSPYTIC